VKRARILFTGGGTAGHVTPNLALMAALASEGHEIHYAGSRDGIERRLVASRGIPYHVLPTGKLRRYLSFENVLDAFRVLAGVCAGWRLARRLRPDLVFSKGGFVSVPVVLGAHFAGVPVVAHESDLTPGLATRLVASRVDLVCTSFPDTQIPEARATRHTGTPVRPELLVGKPARGRDYAELTGDKPVLLVVGGSLGSAFLNGLVRNCVDRLVERYQVVHVCGRDKLAEEIRVPGYVQFEFLGEPYADVLAAADFVVLRAGANAVFELIATAKPALLIPLTTAASRGDQVENALWMAERGLAQVVTESALNEETFLAELETLQAEGPELVARMRATPRPDAMAELLAVIRARLPASESTQL
jgi:UDP-N-acetylglucosamine--N-acetylmuramyl-(pentapeptide) pyrophosphoryl-undecaprenol N-acetylglucosamine transferase